METERSITFNIQFNENERKQAEALAKSYVRRGYTNEGEDDGVTPYEFCIQLLSAPAFKESR